MVILGPSDAKICLVTISIDLYHHLGSGVGNIWQLQLLKEQVNKQTKNKTQSGMDIYTLPNVK